MAIDLKKKVYIGTVTPELMEELDIKTYPTFNNCDHSLIDLSGLAPRTGNSMHTLSVKLPHGKYVTLCVMAPGDEQTCVDVKYTGTENVRAIGFANGTSKTIENCNLYTIVAD